MQLLWTKSANPVDSLIGLMTGQDCAHFAIFFESPGGGIVFESNLLGTHPAFFNTWKKGRTVIHRKDVPLSLEQENALWDKWVVAFDGEPYDYPGALYCGLMILRERLFKIKKPHRNPWAKANSFFCDEIYQLVSGLPGIPVIGNKCNSMDSPHDVWEKIK